MKRTAASRLLWLAAAAMLAFANAAQAVIDGVSGTTFNLVARADYINSADGNVHYMWGYANGAAGSMQYPGPTMIVAQGATVTVNLGNELSVPVSIVFPGQAGVSASGGNAGVITREAPPGGSVSYTFVATEPGTYMYHSGTQQHLQVEMGLIGALVVRPSIEPARRAYAHPGTAFDREYLFVLSEIDPLVHAQVEQGNFSSVDPPKHHSTLWFINGRNGPDTLLDASIPWMPTQPYNSVPRMHPGEKILLRIANAGRDLHPFHTHGNNAVVIARDGRVLESAPGAGPDLAYSDFTVKAIPGETYDATWEWTGKNLGFDAYGHAPGDPMAPNEYAPDHGKPLPVALPSQLDLTFGEYYSGSPFLGKFGQLPVGHPGLNQTAGFFHMFHSHTERELTNDDIFPGGMMTMVVVEPASVPIP